MYLYWTEFGSSLYWLPLILIEKWIALFSLEVIENCFPLETLSEFNKLLIWNLTLCSALWQPSKKQSKDIFVLTQWVPFSTHHQPTKISPIILRNPLTTKFKPFIMKKFCWNWSNIFSPLIRCISNTDYSNL